MEKLIGTRGENDGSGMNRIFYDLEDMKTDALPVPQNATATEREYLREENSRRRRARRLHRSITYLTVRSESLAAANKRAIANDPHAQQMLDKFNQVEKIPEDATEQEIKIYRACLREHWDEAERVLQHKHATRARCRRYKEIESYLFKNRLELALDTMASSMPLLV
jgi:hypothetical protein